MQSRSLKSSFALAAIVAGVSFSMVPQAQAQGLFEFLWGGGQEWGGGKQTVSFDSKYTPGQIIVSFGDRRLYLITKSGTAISYPVAVPRDVDRWQGTTSITDKRVNPSWRPTPEMLRENPKLPLWVPGGHRMNPLGVRAMYLGSSMYRIHGTDAPWTIGQAVSKGCIRMLNEDVLDLYPRVPVGTKVTVTWQRFSAQNVASSDDSAPAPAAAASSGPIQPFFKTPVRSIRPRTPASGAEMVAATDAETVAQPSSDDETLAAAAEKPLAPAPVKKAEAQKKPVVAEPVVAKHEEPATAVKHVDPAAAAKKAAAAAQKAATAARAAAEAAKKAAEDAQRAMTDQGGKSAAL